MAWGAGKGNTSNKCQRDTCGNKLKMDLCWACTPLKTAPGDKNPWHRKAPPPPGLAPWLSNLMEAV